MNLYAIPALFLIAATAQADCDMSSFEKAVATCSAKQIINLETVAHDQAKPVRVQEMNAANAAAETKLSKTNKATTAPDPFAARLHNSYQDFLTPFAFAINKVEESKDGQALIVRFNPLRDLGPNVGFTLTAAKPSILDDVKKAIPETKRNDTVAALDKKLGDFDDVTVAGSFTRVRKCTVYELANCFGRNPATYRDLVSAVLFQPALLEVANSGPAEDASKTLDRLARQLFGKGGINHPFGDVSDPNQQRAIYDAAFSAGNKDAADSAKYLAVFKKLGLDQLATLIDNQPQLAATMSYRSLGPFSGPNEYAGTLEFQVGRRNLRSVAKKCPAPPPAPAAVTPDTEFTKCLAKDLADPANSTINSDKFVFSASYKRSDHFKLADLGDLDVTGFTPVSISRKSEWQGKAQWGRRLGTRVTNEQPRFDVSGDFTRRNQAGVRKLNRFVATATLTVPYGENMSLPVSLSYANKADFLGDPRKKLSMHFGLSYRLPWEKAPETAAP